MPERIQRRRTKGWRMPEGAVYVGRPTIFGNPWVVGHAGVTATAAVDLYREWILSGTPERGPRGYTIPRKVAERGRRILTELPELRGHDLACWCPPGPCHADVLLGLANA